MGRSAESYANGLRLSREAKRRRTGTCRVCGTTTRYSGRDGASVSDLCQPCAAVESGHRQRGTGELNSRIRDYLTVPRRAIEVADAFSITQTHAGVALHRLLSYGLIRRVKRGVYVRVDK